MNIYLRAIEESDKQDVFEIFLNSRPDLLELISYDNQNENVILSQFDLSQRYLDFRELDTRYVIVYENRTIGTLYLRINEKKIEVVSFAILPLFRNKGIGTYILNEIINKYSDEFEIRLNVAWYNNEALKLYLRLGFEEIEDLGVYKELGIRRI